MAESEDFIEVYLMQLFYIWQHSVDILVCVKLWGGIIMNDGDELFIK